VGGTCQVLELRSKVCCCAAGVVVASSSVSAVVVVVASEEYSSSLFVVAVVVVVVVSGAGFAWMCSWLLFFENGIWYAVRLCWGVQLSVSVSVSLCAFVGVSVLLFCSCWECGWVVEDL